MEGSRAGITHQAGAAAIQANDDLPLPPLLVLPVILLRFFILLGHCCSPPSEAFGSTFNPPNRSVELMTPSVNGSSKTQVSGSPEPAYRRPGHPRRAEHEAWRATKVALRSSSRPWPRNCFDDRPDRSCFSSSITRPSSPRSRRSSRIAVLFDRVNVGQRCECRGLERALGVSRRGDLLDRECASSRQAYLTRLVDDVGLVRTAPSNGVAEPQDRSREHVSGLPPVFTCLAVPDSREARSGTSLLGPGRIRRGCGRRGLR